MSQLGPLMQWWLVDAPFDQDELFRDSQVRVDQAAALFELPARYLSARLHDGSIEELEVGPSEFTLSVNDLDFQWLGTALTRAPGYRGPMAAMPVRYEFRDCSFVAAYSVEETGNLLPLASGRVVRRVREFLYADVVPGERDSLLWACILWGRSIGHVVVVVECRSPRIIELHREAWQAQYGADSLWIHDAYTEVKDRVSFMTSDPRDFLRSIGVSSAS